MKFKLAKSDSTPIIIGQLLSIIFLLALGGLQVVSAQTSPPACTNSLGIPNDNDGINDASDFDKDNDGLIEICDFEGLNEMRFVLDGSGYKASANATIATTGCPSSGCKGYELMRDLDFKDSANYRSALNRLIWANGAWQAVGSDISNAFNATFEGNSHTISNLFISRSDATYIGLFGYLGSLAKIANVGLPNVNITGGFDVGSLAGYNGGAITNSYAMGTVSGTNDIGGLVGDNRGTITNGYAIVTVSGNIGVGGLVGNNWRTITNSYATGTVSGNSVVGGLAGQNPLTIINSYATGAVSGNSRVGSIAGYSQGRIINSYATGTVSGSNDTGGLAGYSPGRITNSYAIGNRGIGVPAQLIQTAEALKSPTTATGIYGGWSSQVWDFGTSDQFPILKDSGSNTLLPNQGIGLRELEVLASGMRLNPTFGVSTTHYVVAFLSHTDTARNIVLELKAYNPDATIKIVKQGENPVIDYFSGQGSGGVSNRISVRDNTMLDITVNESNGDSVFYRIVWVRTTLPPCTVFINYADDNDGVAQVMDIDKDNDGLIEICDLEGLDEMRFVLDGSGYRASANATITMTGCPSNGCKGYELMKDLDFMADTSYRTIANKVTWTTDRGWQPIGRDLFTAFAATLEGNGHTISKLMIRRGGEDAIGLIGATVSVTKIANLGLLNVNIRGNLSVGSLVGRNGGTITNSHATGSVGGNSNTGGLVGSNFGTITNSNMTGNVDGGTNTGGLVGSVNFGTTIRNSYATGNVSGNSNTGGLVGSSFGTIRNSYATGNVDGGDYTGGLIGRSRSGAIINSYATGNVDGDDNTGGLTGRNDSSAAITDSYAIQGGGSRVPAQVTRTDKALKSPTAATGIYSNWSPQVWDFGTSDQFPVLKGADSNTLLPNQGMGLRELETLTDATELSPAFGVSTSHYVIAFRSLASTAHNIVLRLKAYNPDATIEIVKRGENPIIDYFSGKGTSGISNPISINDNTILDITVSESNGASISYRILLVRTTLPPCLTSLNYPDDNDGILQAFDIDRDNNGLIEICDLEGLNEMRFILDGSGYKASANAMLTTTGCPLSGCKGYELTTSLDFTANASYRAIANKTAWTTGSGWQAIGNFLNPFNATFEGNGYTISNLMINRNTAAMVGLFGATESKTEIAKLGLLNADITGLSAVGGLVGSNNNSTITSSYVTGNIRGTANLGGLVGVNDDGTITNSHATSSIVGSGSDIGGLVGNNTGTIMTSYATGSVSGGGFRTGGLVGNNDGIITNSYATGSVTALFSAAGLVGVNTASGSITNSYATGNATALVTGGLVAVNSGSVSKSYFLQKVGVTFTGGSRVPADAEQTAEALKSPTAATGIYSGWSSQAWDFGTSDQFPILKDSGSNMLFPNQGTGLRELRVLTANTRLSPIFGVSTTHYVIAFVSANGTVRNIVLRLTAYNSDATIEIVKQGEDPVIDYFADKGSSGSSNPITIGNNTMLNIMVTESDGNSVSYRIVGLFESGMPSCTTSLEFPNDNDGIAQAADIDKDNNGLIEICDLEGVNEMRFVLDGSGYKAGADAITITRGCASGGCKGYELTRSLDFMANDDYRTITNKTRWTTGNGWQAISNSVGNPFNATFDGNGHTISNLTGMGLFGYTGSEAKVANVGLLAVNVASSSFLGSLVNNNRGTVTNSYATGNVIGMSQSGTGGLVGLNAGTITNSYATVNVNGGTYTGGLVGWNSLGTIENSYAIGNVNGGTNTGGLAGASDGLITASYAIGGGGTGVPIWVTQTAEALKSPTMATGIYSNWIPQVWDFGTSDQYPLLKDSDNNTLLPNQGVGLRELEVLTVGMELSPIFGDSTTHYVIAFLPADGTMRSVVLRLKAYNPDATIAIVKRGEDPLVDYFSSEGGSGTSNPITIGDNTVLDITVSESNLLSTSYNIVLAQTNLPLCTAFLNLADDNDGVFQTLDVDKDNNGLIEICDLEGLNEIRYQLDGSGYKINADAMPLMTGCAPGGCRGFELTRNLDFMANDSYRTTSNKITWTSGDGWQPIANSSLFPFDATFEGNGYTISNLIINRGNSDGIGLFGYTRSRTKIANLGLPNVDIVGRSKVGGLVGENAAAITKSYVTGSVSGDSDIGGLVGWNSSATTITNSYATADVNGSDSSSNVGGLVGHNQGSIANSYAASSVIGASKDSGGGLVGFNQASITDSYAIGSQGVGVPAEVPQTAEALKSPTTATGIYSNWSPKVWDFGTSDQFPILKDADGNILLPNQGVGLRELEVLTFGTELRPTFGVSTTHYAITFLSVNNDTHDIVLKLAAYNRNATIAIVKPGEDPAIDYFVGNGSSGTSNPITISDNTVLDITVTESNLSTVFYRIILLQIRLPLCTAYLNFPDDNDGVSQAMDVDKDNDGLIEICDVEGLNEIRYRLDGSGYRASSDGMVITTGCARGGCRGFELSGSLDFMANDSYRTVANKMTWTGGNGWQPIGDSADTFNATFEGNGYTISNFRIDRGGANEIALFGETSSATKIANVGLLNVNVVGKANAGGLVGANQGSITSSYVTGNVRGNTNLGGLVGINQGGSITTSYAAADVTGEGSTIGGLVGISQGGSITTSYAAADVIGSVNIGGLVGFNFSTSITNSYATGNVNGSNRVGGLVGFNRGIITNNYATGDVTGDSNRGGLVGFNENAITDSYAIGSRGSGVAIQVTQTAEALKSPTTATGIYSNWSTDIWDFGTADQFPILKDSDNGTLLPNQGVGLRELEVLATSTRLSPTFGVSTTHYVMTFLPLSGTMRSIVVRLRTYNPDATIEIVKLREAPVIDYFSGKGSNGESDPIAIGDNTMLDITVNESDGSSVAYRIVGLLETDMPLCTLSLSFPDDNDGVLQTMDIDKDNNGLIEICDVEGLSEMRYRLDGSGYKASADAMVMTKGCAPGGCKGYELTRSLNFLVDADYRTIANRATLTGGSGWQPIGGFQSPFNTTFDGNGYTIANLRIDRDSLVRVGLFGHTSNAAKIANIGLLNVDVVGGTSVGGLVGDNQGSITGSYVIGDVRGNTNLGGLVGFNQGSITNSYAAGDARGSGNAIGGLVGLNLGGSITISYAAGNATGDTNVGGLVGSNFSASITNSYATGNVNGSNSVGGLVGLNQGESITNSYATGNATGDTDIGGLVGDNRGTITDSYAVGSGGSGVPIQVTQTAEALKLPTTATGIYDNWSTKIWDFGTSDQFPILKNSDNNASLAGQGKGLRTLETLTVSTRLSPTFGVSTTHYVMTFLPLSGTTASIVLGLRAYNPDATIKIVKRGEDPAIDYFTSEGNVSTSNPITLGDNTMLDITVSESDGSIVSYRVVGSLEIDLPLCTTSLGFADDNDGVFELADVDKDNDGLIEICDVEGINEMRYQLDGSAYKASADAAAISRGCAPGGCKGFELMRSLDFAVDTNYRITTNRMIYTVDDYDDSDDNGWQPIADSLSVPFNATFTGNGHTIANLMINRGGANGIGLFAYTGSSAEIANLGVLNIDIRGNTSVGGLVGRNNGRAITNSYTSGIVIGSGNDVGGLVGRNIGPITDSYAAVDVTGSGDDSGGLVGDNTGSITNSYATGNVRNRDNRAGGLVGFNQGPISNSHAIGDVTAASSEAGGLVGWNLSGGRIANSYATGEVVGSGNFAGGLIGNNNDSITNSYATGSVTGAAGFDDYAGGLVGGNIGTITNSYATGKVADAGNLGGLAGFNAGSINHVYWLQEIGSTLGGGIDVAEQAAQTAEALKSPTTATGIYHNWSTEIWDFGTADQFPVLKDADSDTLLANQGVGLRELETLTAATRLTPTFGVSTTHYVMTFFSPTGTTASIVLRLAAYNRDATIKIIKQGEDPLIDYFPGKGSRGIGSPITLADDTMLDITVSEADATTTSYRISASVQANLPPCTTSLGFPDDNDGISAAVDIDKDNNGLIEICDLEGVNEMRFVLDGSGYRASADVPIIKTGCASIGCMGFELMRSLDFMVGNSYRSTASRTIYTVDDYNDDNDNGWQPIGDSANTFNAIFAGNGHTIANLMINRSSSDGIALFGYTGISAEIIDLGLLNTEIRGQARVGGLVGANGGFIINSYTTGSVTGTNDSGGLVGNNSVDGNIISSYAIVDVVGDSNTGGLVGLNEGGIRKSYATGDITAFGNGNGGLVGVNQGIIVNSYATGDINGANDSGGLVGHNSVNSTITNSYAIGDVTEDVGGNVPGDSNVGGLVGLNQGTITDSYALGSEGTGVPTQVGQTIDALQSPTTESGIYSNWEPEVWDFGNSVQFPILKNTDSNMLLPNQGVGLRTLEILTTDIELSPTFNDSNSHYVINFFSPTGDEFGIVLRLRAYDPEATIKIIRQGEDPVIDYFAGRGSSGQSDSITIGESTMLDITVAESDSGSVSYSIIESAQTNLAPCTTSIEFDDDNDGIFQAVDIDKDNDGLIEICDVEGLNEIRYRLDGTGYKASADAPVIMIGCAAGGCTGFELTRDLDFMVDADYRTTANKVAYTVDDYDDGADSGWQPIGVIVNDDCGDSGSDCFSGIFDGNGHSIANLQINRDAVNDNDIGLFIANTGIIRNFGLSAIMVEGNDRVGGLVGRNAGTLMNVHVGVGSLVKGVNAIGLLVGRSEIGSSTINSRVHGTVTSSGQYTGGICGINYGEIVNSYAVVEVSAARSAGGLVGENHGNVMNSYTGSGSIHITAAGSTDVGGLLGSLWAPGRVRNSYSIARVSATTNNTTIGGLIGVRELSSLVVADSYWDTDTSEKSGSDGGDAKTTDELKMPTNAVAVPGVYVNWSPADWDFGTSEQYPALKYALGGDIANPACDTDAETSLPDCDSLLPDQREIPNTTPTITTTFPLSITLLEGGSSTFNIVVSDVDDDELGLEIGSSDSAVATAMIIAAIGGGNRTLELSGVGVGETTITVTVDDGRNAANSRALLSFRVMVIRNLGPMISITPSRPQTMQLNSVSDIMKVSVADDNFHLNDRIALAAISSSPTIVLVTPTRVSDITTNQTVVFTLNAAQGGVATIRFVATDNYGLSDSGMVSVRVNTPPTITGIPGQAIRLLEGTETELDLTINDENADDIHGVRLSSSDNTIATATIVATNAATRTLEIAGINPGTAMITVTVDDGRGVENSEVSAQFEVEVAANEAPMLETFAASNQTIEPGSTAQLIVLLVDNDFGLGDRVTLTAKSSTPSIVSVMPERIDDIRASTSTSFILSGNKVGATTITFIATDSKDASANLRLVVQVNTPPQLVPDQLPAEVVMATVGELFELRTGSFFADADGDVLTYGIAIEPVGLSYNFSTTNGTWTFIATDADASQTRIGSTVTVSAADDKGGRAQVTFILLINAQPTGSVSIAADDSDKWLLRVNSTIADANGIATTSHQWFRDGEIINGETGDTYSIPDNRESRAAGTTYRAEVSIVDNIGQSVTSATEYTVANIAPVILGVAGTPSPANEGDEVTMVADVMDENNDSLVYGWRVTSGHTGVDVSVNSAELSFTVPDYLIESETVGQQAIGLRLEISDGLVPLAVSTMTSVVVNKKDNGVASVNALRRDSTNERQLDFTGIDATDETDGGVNGDVAYHWQRCWGSDAGVNCVVDSNDWSDISGEGGTLDDSQISYTVPANLSGHAIQRGDRFRFRVAYIDRQGYPSTAHSASLGARLGENTTPTIMTAFPQTFALLEGISTTLNIVVGDADGGELGVELASDDGMIASATIVVASDDATRTIEIIGVDEGATTITATVDDGVGEANSRAFLAFRVMVKANTTPTISLRPAAEQIVQLNSTVGIVVLVADDDFDLADRVTLAAVSSSQTIVSVVPVRVDDITTNTSIGFMLSGAEAGAATIMFTATDLGGLSDSKHLSVNVNSAPQVVSAQVPAQVLATVGKMFELDTAHFFDDADGDVLTYAIAVEPSHSLSYNFSTTTGIWTFTATDVDASQTTAGLTVTVSASDGRGGSAQTAFMLLIDAQPTGSVSIKPDSSDQWLLHATSTIEDANGIATTSHQWFRNGNIISGETGISYSIADDRQARAIGTIYRLEVTVVDDIGQSVTTQSNAYAVANEKPVIVSITDTQTINETATTQNISVAVTASDANYDGLSYSWSINTGMLSNANRNTAILIVPPDFVKDIAATKTTVNLEVVLSDGTDSTTGMVSVIVNKKNNGSATLGDSMEIVNDEAVFTATILSPDPDGGINGAVMYQWQICLANADCSMARNWQDIAGATGIPYTIMSDSNLLATDNSFRVRGNYSDGQGYPEEIYSPGQIYIPPVLSIKIRVKVFLEGPLQ